MASNKTLALLEILRALTRYFEIIAEEETANEVQVATEETTTASTGEATSSSPVEGTPPVEGSVEINLAQEAATETDTLPTPAPEPFGIVQSAPSLSGEDVERWRQETDDAIATGNFRIMTDLQRQLRGVGLQDFVQIITDELTRRNTLQAQCLRDDRDNTLRSLSVALEAEDLRAAQRIYKEDLPRIGDRLHEGLNSHVRLQLETLEGRSIAEIRSAFLEFVRDANKRIETMEHAAEKRKQELIANALQGNVNPAAKKRVQGLISLIRASRGTGNAGAIRSFIGQIESSEENRLAAIASLGSYNAYCSFMTIDSATQNPPSKRELARRHSA